jgi:hypothetical protein
LNEPANVILEIVNLENRFKVHFIKNETGCVFMPTKSKRIKRNQGLQNQRSTFNSHITESDLQAIAAVNFNQPGVYNWSQEITRAVADKKAVNCLVKFFVLYISNFYKNNNQNNLFKFPHFCRTFLDMWLNLNCRMLIQSS